MPRYFVHDLETDRIHIHTDGKADWLTIPEADRNTIKSNCLWSGSRKCFMSRRKGGYIYFRDVLTRNGFEDRGRDGERLTFAEQVEAKQERAEARAERSEDRADRAQTEAESHRKAGDAISDHIPFGQPILVGHHSEKRHRSDIAKIHRHMRGTCEALDRKKHYERRADAARATAEGKQYSDPAYLARRIKEQEAVERQALRLLAKMPGEPTDSQKEALARIRDQLEFYRHCLETCGVAVFNRETLKGKTMVFLRGRWELIVRLNPTTVAIPNICFPDPVHQRKWALKYLYAEVRDAR